MDLSKKLEFISLYEVYEEEGRDCPLCTLARQREERYLRSVLDGELLIKPDLRQELIRYHFCTLHLDKLFSIHDKLGLALLLEGYLKMRVSELHGTTRGELSSRILKFLAGLGKASEVSEGGTGCGICRYVLTADSDNVEKLLMLLVGDSAFKTLFQKNYRMLCHKHYLNVLSRKNSKGKGNRQAVDAVMGLQTEHLAKVQRDLEWFIQKFNYKNREMPWYDARDSLQRVIEYFK